MRKLTRVGDLALGQDRSGKSRSRASLFSFSAQFRFAGSKLNKRED
jgi:hypothetical protein